MRRPTTLPGRPIAAVLAAAAVAIAALVVAQGGTRPAQLSATADPTSATTSRGHAAATGTAGLTGTAGAAGTAAGGVGAGGTAMLRGAGEATGKRAAAALPRAVAAALPPALATALTGAIGGALPGATASIAPAAAGGGDVVTIAAPADAFQQPGAGQPGFPTGSPAHAVDDAAWREDGDSAIPDAPAAGTAGWRAGMIGAYTASNDPSVVGWTLTASGVALSSQAEDYLHANVRVSPGSTIGWPSQTLIGQVSTADATRQLDSNLAVLSSVLGSDLVATATTVVPVGPSTFGFDVDLKVTSLAAIAPHITDVWLGLATGLVAGPQSAIEGLAINIVDASGARASQWANGRDGDGGGIGNPALPQVSTVDVAFPDLTGGPPAQAAVPTTLPTLPPGVTYVPVK
jgi:hypothetical protein